MSAACNPIAPVGGTAFTSYSRKASEEVGLLADSGEDFGFRVLGDVVCDRKSAVSARAFGMHAALGDDLTVEVSEFLQKPRVLKQHRSTWSSSHNILVIGNRSAYVVGKFLGHDSTSFF